jgi:hypothetical protein
MSGIANNPDTENRWPSATPAKLERAHSVSAILNELAALKTKIVTYLLRLLFCLLLQFFPICTTLFRLPFFS